MTRDNAHSPLSTDPYKGVRDFYPEDKRVQNYIFSKMREVAESFGYQEYDASVLEPAELYETKSGEEIVNEQMYVFEDRGARRVALRPEMTPTLARMVASRRRELSLPIRWYTIANMFRYERPQRGRLREHWQLNCDIIGTNSIDADVETILVANSIMLALGLKSDQFVIHINSRELLDAVFSHFGLNDEQKLRFSKLLDRRAKIDKTTFVAEAEKISDKSKEVMEVLDAENNQSWSEEIKNNPAANRPTAIIEKLSEMGIKNTEINTGIVRGFDYYTGMVFEVFDMHPNNNRALFGGGRYDNLLEIFGAEKIPAVGFAMGDVAIRDTLETYELLPDNLQQSTTQLYICVLGEEYATHATTLAQNLRKQGLKVTVDYSNKKVGDQIKKANKDGVPHVLFVGEEEVKSGKYKVRNMETREEASMVVDKIQNLIK